MTRHDVTTADELPEGGPKLVDPCGPPIVIFNRSAEARDQGHGPPTAAGHGSDLVLAELRP